jgi:hypothetical protein
MSTPLRVLQLNGAAYGWLLAVTTLLSLIVIAHHPVASGHDPAAVLRNVAASGNTDRWVHGLVILIVLLLTTGISGFAWRLGIAHPLVMAGWLSQVFGAVALIGAGLIDGFVIPDLAGMGAARGEAGAYDLLALCGAWIQADTRLGFVLTALSAVFLGHALLHHRGGALWIGLLGIGVGGFSAVFVLTLTARFNPPLLLAYMTGQTAWYLTVAFWMIRGLRRPD